MAYKFTAIPGVGAGATTPAAPGSYPFQAVSGIGAKVTPYTQVRDTTFAPVGNSSAKVPTGSAAEPWWMTGLNVLSSTGKVVTDQIGDWSDWLSGKRDFDWRKDAPIASAWYKNYQEANRIATGLSQGDFKFDNIPGLGSMSYIGREGKGFDHTLANMGVQNDKALFWGGLAGDIALDPLTWLTFGGSSAVKAGGKAMAKSATEVAADYGVAMGRASKKAIRNLPEAIDYKVFNDLLESGSSIRVAGQQAEHAANIARETVQNAGKAARSKAQNALFNIDIPFTKITYQIGDKPAKWTKTSPAIKTQGANALGTLMTRYGIDPSTTGAEFVQKALGKTNLEDITYQEYNWLKGELKNYSDFAAKAQKAAPNPFEGGSKATQFGTKAISTGNAPAAFDPLTAYKFGSEFVADMGGRSTAGQKFVDKFRAINPRQVGDGAAGSLVNEAGGLLQDTFNRIRNNLGNRLPARIQDVMKQAENFSPADQKALAYVMEGEFPKGFDMNSFDSTKVHRMADTLRKEFDEMASAEGSAGVLDKTLGGYFPHVVNKSPEKVEELLQKYADDPELQALAKVSASNTFNQSRKSFKTFAQLDNYIAGIGQKIASETDPAAIAQLQAKLDDVSGIFERDPFKAFQKRLYKSYRVRELGDMYKTMKDDGLLLEPDIASYDRALYKRLDSGQAKRLNVPNGTVMHKDVAKALMKADEIFTNDGMNKFLEKVTSVTNIWKALTTTIRPVHHLNNLVGNIFNNTLAGVEASSYKRAMETLNRVSRGKPKQEDLDLMELAMKNGIFGQGHSDEYRRIFGEQQAKGIRKVENFAQNNKVTSFMRKWLGDTTDNWSRLAHFESVLGKTGSDKLAAESTRKYLFNYGESTGADQAIRLLIPFWTWTKNNIPLQLEQLMKQPRYYQTYLRLQDASYESQGLDRHNQRDFVRDAYFATPWGTARNPRAPITDLNNLSSPQEILKFLVNSSSPLVKTPFEQVAGKSFFTGAPIDNQWEYGLQQLPIFNDIYKMATGQSSVVDWLTGKELDVNK